jgi:hypothetical protein
MAILDVVYIYIELQTKFISLLPKKFPMTLGYQGPKTKSYGAKDMMLIGKEAVLRLPSLGIFVGLPHGPKPKLGILAS